MASLYAAVLTSVAPAVEADRQAEVGGELDLPGVHGDGQARGRGQGRG